MDFASQLASFYLILLTFRVVCTNVDPNLIADQRYFKAKYLQNGEENWTKK